jgi:hypothetical protein
METCEFGMMAEMPMTYHFYLHLNELKCESTLVRHVERCEGN